MHSSRFEFVCTDEFMGEVNTIGNNFLVPHQIPDSCINTSTQRKRKIETTAASTAATN